MASFNDIDHVERPEFFAGQASDAGDDPDYIDADGNGIAELLDNEAAKVKKGSDANKRCLFWPTHYSFIY